VHPDTHRTTTPTGEQRETVGLIRHFNRPWLVRHVKGDRFHSSLGARFQAVS